MLCRIQRYTGSGGPTAFDEVKGQDHIVTTLRNQIAFGTDRPRLSVLRNQGDRKDKYCKDICQSGEL